MTKQQAYNLTGLTSTALSGAVYLMDRVANRADPVDVLYRYLEREGLTPEAQIEVMKTIFNW